MIGTVKSTTTIDLGPTLPQRKVPLFEKLSLISSSSK